MIRKFCAVGTALALTGSGLVVSGCGSSSSASRGSASAATSGSDTTTLAASGKTLVEAADRAAAASGYRMNATMKIQVGTASVSMQMAGVIEAQGARSALTAKESVEGKTITLKVRLANQLEYMTGIPGLSRLSGGKQWVAFNLAQAQGAEGLEGLQGSSSTNPAQFLEYLRTVGTGVTPVGSATIDGDATTEYRATLQFNRYTKLLPPAKRAAAGKVIAQLEKETGTTSLPVTVWVDRRHEVRRMHLALPSCADGRQLSMSMTLNLSDYGDVPPVTLPAASDTDNITGKLKSEVASEQQSADTGCPASGG